MIVSIGEEDVYHEAGHAVMFCYYNIPIQYVSVRPQISGKDCASEFKCWASG